MIAKRKIAVGYLRVSTEEQASEGVSLDVQRSRIPAYIAAKDLGPYELIEDAGYSGKDLKRPGIQRLLSMTARGEVSAVVVLKIDRLSRRVRDILNTVEPWNEQGVALHSVSESIDTGGAAGTMFFNLLAVFAQFERDRTAERTREALARKRECGERIGTVPYGWRLKSHDASALEEYPAEQAAIREMQRLRHQGLSLREIGKHLDTSEIPAKNGGRWGPKVIRDILSRS